ncbi:MAG: hypothetical protein R2850_08930 [Bacteroidia bacterium]
MRFFHRQREPGYTIGKLVPRPDARMRFEFSSEGGRSNYSPHADASFVGTSGGASTG